MFLEASGRPTVHLQDLHPLAPLVLADEPHPTGLFQPLDVLRPNLVPMPVSFPNSLLPAVQLPQLALLRTRFEQGRSEAEPHGPSQMGLGDFGHEDDDRVRRLGCEFGGMGVLQAAHVPSPFDDGDLEPEADTQEGHLLLPRPLDGGDHTLGPSMSESTGDDDPLGATDGPPGVVVLDRVRGLGLGLEVGRVDPLEVELFAAAHGSVFERLDDGHVRVLEGDVFAYEDDGDGLVAAFGAGSCKENARSA